MPVNYMTKYYGAVFVEEYDTGHGEELCCGTMEQLVELSNGFVVGNEWDECWLIPLFLETRKDIEEHSCEA